MRERWMGHWTQRSTDSGLTWEEPVRSTGSAPHGPVELDDGRLLYLGSGTFDGVHGLTAEESTDQGRSWQVIGTVPTEPFKTAILGYPAHMIRLEDKRVLLVYGVRVPPFGERARVSVDEGESWSEEIVLCTDTSPDLGYPASAQLPDGSILTVYYAVDKPGEPTCLMGIHWRLGGGS